MELLTLMIVMIAGIFAVVGYSIGKADGAAENEYRHRQEENADRPTTAEMNN